MIGLKGFAINNARTLYAPAALGIDGFLFAKEKIKSQFTNSVDKFKEKMTEFSQESSSMKSNYKIRCIDSSVTNTVFRIIS